MRKFEKTITHTISTAHVNLSGFINEQAEFGVTQFSRDENLIINFKLVTLINSTGILKWVNWINNVAKHNPKVKIMYAFCPKIIVDQINLVRNFLPPGATVNSFYLPYYCEGCNSQASILIESGKEFEMSRAGKPGYVKVPSISCAHCKSPMTEDFIQDKYFQFLKG